jgi:hypothetical protein
MWQKFTANEFKHVLTSRLIFAIRPAIPQNNIDPAKSGSRSRSKKNMLCVLCLGALCVIHCLVKNWVPSSWIVIIPKYWVAKAPKPPHWSSTIHHVSTQLCPHMLDGLCDMNYVWTSSKEQPDHDHMTSSTAGAATASSFMDCLQREVSVSVSVCTLF